MPALQRAIAFAEMNGLAVSVAQNLDFDMARLFKKFFEIDRIIAESGLGLGPRRFDRGGKIMRRARDFHAASAAARRRLYKNRKTQRPGDDRRLLIAGDRAGRARHAGNTKPDCRRFGLDLIAHEPDMLRFRPHESDVMILENLREPRILRKKPIARMQGFGAGDFAGRKKRWNVQIGIAGRRRPDAHQFIGELHMHRIGVSRRMNRHGRDAKFLGGAQNPSRRFRHDWRSEFCRTYQSTGDQALFDDKQRLAIFDRLAILDQNARHRAGPRGQDLVEGFHRLDEKNLVAGLDLRADLDKRRRHPARNANKRFRPSATLPCPDHRLERRRGARSPRAACGGATAGWMMAAESCRATRILKSPFATSISESPRRVTSCRQGLDQFRVDCGRRPGLRPVLIPDISSLFTLVFTVALDMSLPGTGQESF